jgi:hypothetical protein
MKIKINIAEVLQREKEKREQVRPLPTIRVVRKDDLSTPAAAPASSLNKTAGPVDEKQLLLNELIEKSTRIRKERAKLSSKSWFIIEDIKKKLAKEGAAVVKAFENGDIPVPAIKEHYAAIQSHTDALKELYDKIRFVEQYGALPKEKPLVSIENKESKDANAIHYEIRRLDDLIYKCNNKLTKAGAGIKKPKNSARLEKWKLKIEFAEAKRIKLKQELKRLQYESREQRTIAG